MSGRGKQLIVLLLLGMLTLLTVGCFGGGDSSETTESTTAVTGGPGGTTGGTLSGEEVLVPIDGLPAEFTGAFQSKPIVVLFYVPGNADDQSVLDTTNRLKPSFDQYLFLVYDYKDPNAYGTLARLLEVDYPPYMVLIDSRGFPRRVFKGFVDEGTLNQELVNLGRE